MSRKQRDGLPTGSPMELGGSTASVKSLLQLGVTWFDVSHGLLVRGTVRDARHTVIEISDPHSSIRMGDRVDLAAAHRRANGAANSRVWTVDATERGATEDADRVGYCFGTLVTVNGDPYGAVCFLSDELRETDFSDEDDTFLDLLTQAIERSLLRTKQKGALDRAAHRLEKTESLLKQVQDVVGVGAWELDLEGKTSSWTDTIYDVCGLSRENPLNLGALFRGVQPAARKEIERALWTCVRDREPFRVEVFLRTEDGTRRWIEVHAVPQVVDGSVRRITGTFRDTTERKRRLDELQRAQRESVSRLARAAELRDFETGAHTQRVGVLARDLAKELGQPLEWQERIREAAPLHDVGKIGISDRILLKPGPLTDDEFETMKAHASIGARLLSGGGSQLLKMAEQIARCHHEHWDGTGYPEGLAGEEIPLAARIVSIVDAFDAMTNDRPYRKALGEEEAIDRIRAGRGTQFCPQGTDAFLRQRAHSAAGS